ncbi:MAG: glycosyltransferase, partial [Acidobacteria bacterium]|nr:glycosyltransferase [Acidobacteriota bacterium]
MRVFMLGWEFPPFISGGLGTACYGLTKAMSSIGTDIMFVLPRPVSTPFSTHLRLVSPRADSPLAAPSTELRLDEFEHVTFRAVGANLSDPYQTPDAYEQERRRPPEIQPEVTRGCRATPVAAPAEVAAGAASSDKPAAPSDSGKPAAPSDSGNPAAGGATPGFIGNPAHTAQSHYAGDLFSEIQRYAALASEVARNEHVDVVHAHDWMTFPAGLAVAGIKGKPLVVHVHSTEFDRSGANVDQRIYDIERRGMHGAMKVIAVSALTKSIIVHQYGIDPSKVEVVYNAIDVNGTGFDEEKYSIHKEEKIVLYLGRITMQKGPEYFVAAAKK